MRNTASNYDVTKLGGGAIIAVIATTLATLAIAEKEVSPPSFAFALICLSYGFMMFASSYIEEEQHFWYWAASAWLGYLALKRYRLQETGGFRC